MSVPDPDVIAAGAVVVRKGAVLLVHRPKYDDWSFPKGKQDPGEDDVVTAVREVAEETGVEVRLGMPLPSTAYVQLDGRTKLVHYWRATVVGDHDVTTYRANDEIDDVAWVPTRRGCRSSSATCATATCWLPSRPHARPHRWRCCGMPRRSRARGGTAKTPNGRSPTRARLRRRA